ncbi:MAG TPA: response regulator [Nitrospirae bacterium]|nr:cyclic di-GMP phosphodiesterase response regulator RpfG [bacterium BMS3Abin10]GBE38078.1 cyclic di-GMP phosphodiesterase response regulator RpfG [bacterium BMS3Bbin08]HDK16915.1 response regulator [Nitrospirota bacterium]HDZ83943.1 response regulator [Nitrospirota bacterium]
MNNRDKILIIDDELSPRESMRMVLRDRYNVSTASGGYEGLEFMERNAVDLVVLDIKMPGMDGITALKEIKKKYPDTEVILLTAFASLETAKSAVRFGALDYLTKPFDKDDVLTVVEKGLDKKRNSDRLKVEREKLLFRNRDLEAEVNKARENILMGYEGTIQALIKTIDAKDHYTFDHSEHVSRMSSTIADVLGLSKEAREKIEHAAAIHDIGKIGIDERILKKQGPLTDEEFSDMKQHPEIGTSIVQSVPLLEDAIPVILHHHERYDGNGYPAGLKGAAIPLNARIVIVADAVDAMMRARPYRGSLPMEKVLSELRDNAGTQFDPAIVDIILKDKVSLK